MVMDWLKKYTMNACFFDKMLLCTYSSISTHLRLCHKVSIQAYEEKYMRQMVELDSFEIDIASETQSTNQISDWVNKCQFACKMCNYGTNIYTNLYRHVKTMHQLQPKDCYDVVKLVEHSCIICTQEKLCRTTLTCIIT